MTLGSQIFEDGIRKSNFGRCPQEVKYFGDVLRKLYFGR